MNPFYSNPIESIKTHQKDQTMGDTFPHPRRLLKDSFKKIIMPIKDEKIKCQAQKKQHFCLKMFFFFNELRNPEIIST